MLIQTEHHRAIHESKLRFSPLCHIQVIYYTTGVSQLWNAKRILWVAYFVPISWGDLSGLGDKVGMVDGSSFDAGKAYKGADPMKWTGKMEKWIGKLDRKLDWLLRAIENFLDSSGLSMIIPYPCPWSWSSLVIEITETGVLWMFPKTGLPP